MVQLGGVEISLWVLLGSVTALVCYEIGFFYWFSIEEYLQKALVADGEIIRNSPDWEIHNRRPTKVYYLRVKYLDAQGEIKFITSRNGRRQHQVGDHIEVFLDPAGRRKPVVDTTVDKWGQALRWFSAGTILILMVVTYALVIRLYLNH